jgi:hypothetical protein
LGSTVTFNGTNTINGYGNELHLSSKGNIVVGKNSTIIFKDITLTGIRDYNIRCFDNSSKIILYDVDWIQDANYSFTVGSLRVQNDCLFSGASLPFVFAFKTTQTTFIDRRSNMMLDQNFTFSYDPINKNKTGIQFVDQTSLLSLNGANVYITQGGMQLKSGNLRVSNASSVSIESGASLIIGNNASSDDCRVELVSGGQLNLIEGTLVYQNVSNNSWRGTDINSILRMYSGTTLQLDQPINLDNGRLLVHKNATIIEATPSSITGVVEFYE